MGKRKTPGTSTRGRADRTFGRILEKRSVDDIVPEVANRLEAGRRLYVERSITSTEAELELLAAERKRLEEKGGDASAARLARVDRLMLAVQVHLAASQTVRNEIRKAKAPVKDGWTVVGRVLSRDGTVPKKVEVVFLSDDGEATKELGVVKPDPDGMVRKVYSADVVKRLLAKQARVRAAVRVGGRIVAQEQFAGPVRPQHVHQFDLRIETAFGDGERARQQGDK